MERLERCASASVHPRESSMKISHLGHVSDPCCLVTIQVGNGWKLSMGFLMDASLHCCHRSTVNTIDLVGDFTMKISIKKNQNHISHSPREELLSPRFLLSGAMAKSCWTMQWGPSREGAAGVGWECSCWFR